VINQDNDSAIKDIRALIDIPYLMPKTNDAQRLFHGRGHAYSDYEHVLIDWLMPVILITLYKEVDRSDLQNLAQHLFSLVSDCQSVQVQYRYLRHAPVECLVGEMIEQLVAKENGLNYHITLGKVQNIGLFLDMKNGRKWVQEHSHNARVLNLFSYTCAFSVVALAGGAASVFNMDMSRKSLTTGRENHRLNHQDTTKVKFEAIDIFKSFGRIKKHGPYDLLICDPPSFQKGSVDIRRDYKKIIRRVPDFMAANSMLIFCLNSPALDADFLKRTVQDECPQCEYITDIKPPEVFVEAIKGKELNVLVFKFLQVI